eukprot:g9656.t1
MDGMGQMMKILALCAVVGIAYKMISSMCASRKCDCRRFKIIAQCLLAWGWDEPLGPPVDATRDGPPIIALPVLGGCRGGGGIAALYPRKPFIAPEGPPGRSEPGDRAPGDRAFAVWTIGATVFSLVLLRCSGRATRRKGRHEALHPLEALELASLRPRRCSCGARLPRRPKFLSLIDVYRPWGNVAKHVEGGPAETGSGLVLRFLQAKPQVWAALLRPEYHTWHSHTKKFHKETREATMDPTLFHELSRGDLCRLSKTRHTDPPLFGQDRVHSGS